MKKGKDGKYHSKIVLAPGTKPVYFEASTLREFNAKRQEIIDTYKNGSRIVSKTFFDVVQEWLEVVKNPRVEAKATQKKYESMARVIQNGIGTKMLCRAVTYKDLQKFVDAQTSGKSLSNASGLISTIHQICRYAVAQGYTDKDPSYALMRPAGLTDGERHALSPEQVQEMWSYKDHRIGLVFAIAYYTGCRSSEIFALTWDDVNWEKNEISINKALSAVQPVRDNLTKTKTKAGTRKIPLLPELKDILFPLRGFPNARILPANANGTPYNRSTIMNDMAALKKKGIAPSFTCHCLRHHFATSCYLAGIPLTVTMQWLGHAAYQVTADTYTDIKRAVEDGDQIDRTLSESLQKVGQKLDVAKTAW